jgi:hypothetical protein
MCSAVHISQDSSVLPLDAFERCEALPGLMTEPDVLSMLPMNGQNLPEHV